MRVSGGRWVVAVVLLALVNAAGWLAVAVLVRGERGPRVVHFSPEGLAGADTVFTVRFSEAVSAASRARPAEALLRFDPEVPGRMAWPDARTAVFRPERQLRMGTPYGVTVLRGVEAAGGAVMGRDYHFRCHTAPLALVSVEQEDLSRDRQVTLRLAFNAPVSAGPLGDHLRIFAAGRMVSFTVLSRVPERVVSVRTAPVAGDRLRVRLERGMLGFNGLLPLPEAREVALVVEAGLTIGGVEAESGDGDGADGVIRVRCSEPLDPVGAADFVVVEPETTWRVEPWPEGAVLRGAFEPDRRYRLTFVRGLSGGATQLTAPCVREVRMPDRRAQLRLGAEGQYLPPGGGALVSVTTVNVPRLQVTVNRIFANTIVPFLASGCERLGRRVAARVIPVAGIRNRPTRQELDLGEMVGAGASGVFRVAVTADGEPALRASRVVVLGDLGLLAKVSSEGVLVWSTHLGSGAAAAGVWVGVYGLDNQVLGEAVTDKDGVAVVAERGWPVAPFAVVARHGETVSFLELAGSRQQTPAGIAGPEARIAVPGAEALVTSDRACYAPGTMVLVRAVVRTDDGRAAGPMAATMAVRRPDGRVTAREPAAVSAAGLAEVAFQLPDDALLGPYRVELVGTGGAALGQARFAVAEPAGEAVVLTVSGVMAETCGAGDRVRVRVDAALASGWPVRRGTVHLGVTVRPQPFSATGWERFGFRWEGETAPVEVPLLARELADDGGAAWEFTIPEELAPGPEWRMEVAALLDEGAGRVVEAVREARIDATGRYVGLQDVGAAGEELEVACGVADADGGRLAGEFPATVHGVIRRYAAPADGRQTERLEERLVWQGAVSVRDGRGRFRVPTAGTLEHVVRVTDPATGAVWRLDMGRAPRLPAGAGEESALPLMVARERYGRGEEVGLGFAPSFAGSALLTVEGAGVRSWRVLPVAPTALQEIRLGTAARWGAGHHAVVTVVGAGGRRVMGAMPLPVTDPAGILTVQPVPGAGDEVAARITDEAGNPAAAELVLTAVAGDGAEPEGSVEQFFFGPRRPAVVTADMFEALARAEGAGAEGVGALAREPATAPLVGRTGPAWQVRGASDTAGMVRFALPAALAGRALRLRLAAATERAVGEARWRRAAVAPALTLLGPETVRPGDVFDASVRLDNGSDYTGPAQLRLEAAGLGMRSAAERLFGVRGGASSLHRVTLVAENEGEARLAAAATLGPDRAVAERGIRVQGAAMAGQRWQTRVVRANEAWEFPGAADGRGQELLCAPYGELLLGGLLADLLAAGHGDLEGTVSLASALLAMRRVAHLFRDPGERGGSVSEALAAALGRLQRMQTRSGGFARWPGGREPDRWMSVWAMHFLLRARDAGVAMDEAMVTRVQTYLLQLLGELGQAPDDQATLVYAGYVLGRCGHPQGERLAAVWPGLNGNSFGVRAMAALAMAEAAMPDAMAALYDQAEEHPPVTASGEPRSPAQDLAMAVCAGYEAGLDRAWARRLADRLLALVRRDAVRATHAIGWTIVALAPRLAAAPGGPASLEVEVDGIVTARLGRTRPSRLSLPAGKRVSVQVRGEGAVVCARTVPVIPDSGGSGGERLRVRRRFLRLNGMPVVEGRCQVGELLVAEVTLEAPAAAGPVCVRDALPAGLQLEEAPLERPLPWLEGRPMEPERVERERHGLFLSAPPGDGARRFRYLVRAVTPGEFQLPPAQANSRHDPENRASGDGGRLIVQ